MGVQALPQETIYAPRAAAPGAERFLVLNSLRGIAAFAVILDHVPSGQPGALVPNRTLSVDFFFKLSGFALAHAYGAKLESGWSRSAFMRMRLIRLYPLYIFGTLIGALALLGQHWPGGAEAV
ncbi:MAG: acyltransferase family protein [Hyphomonadaceae bacterium]